MRDILSNLLIGIGISIKIVGLMLGLKFWWIRRIMKYSMWFACNAYNVFVLSWCLYVPSVCSKNFARPTRKQTTFIFGSIGHVYRCVTYQAERQGWEKLMGFIWGLPSVNKICDKLCCGGEAVAVSNDGLLYWIDVAVHWIGFYNSNVFKWTCSKSEQYSNWMVHFVCDAVRCLFTNVQLEKVR